MALESVEREEAGQSLMDMIVEVLPKDGPDKIVSFPVTGDSPVTMGMYGELAEHYKATPGSFEPRASSLDYVVAGLAACLTGTFRRALVARGVDFSVEDLQARAVGRVEVGEGGVPVLRRVDVSYRLAGVAPDQHESAQRACEVHERGCPVSRSLEGAIEISTTVDLA